MSETPQISPRCRRGQLLRPEIQPTLSLLDFLSDTEAYEQRFPLIFMTILCLEVLQFGEV